MMKNRLKASLVLGCNGFIGSNNFIFCSSVENPIIDLSSLSEETYCEVLYFLEHACDLFSARMNDYNKCVNTLTLLYKKYQLYDQKMLYDVQSFLKKHKDCGIWLILVLNEDLRG